MRIIPSSLLGVILISLFSLQIANTQTITFHNHDHSEHDKEAKHLDEIFSDYDIITKNFANDVAHLQTSESLELELNYKEDNFQLYLHKNYLVDEDYVSRTTGGEKNSNIAITLDGYTGKGDRASISIAHDFIYGYFEDENGDKLHIEPLRFFKKEAAANEFIVFYEKNVLDTASGACGTSHEFHLRKRVEDYKKTKDETAEMQLVVCLEVELAIASDFSMHQKYGSVSAVENRNIGVINDVQTNFIGEFNDDLEFNIVEQFVVSTSGGDPWTSSTDAGVLLNDFTNWGPSGFSATHDMGELWTDRNFNGGTVGIAWVGSVCFSNRYHALQDFTSNTDLTRVLVAHEMGHNFDAIHDPSGSNTIMAPAVNNTNTWSSQSKNDINSFVSTIDPPTGCLAICVSNTVTADFGYVEGSICEGSSVQFFEKASSNATTFTWSFPGGVPASSTSPSPNVTYPAAGSYAVTLTVTNASGGSDSKTINGAINVGAGGNKIIAFEDFEGGSTGSWSASGGQSWQIIQADGVQYGSNTFMVDNFSSSGMVDLESPTIDLLGHANPKLHINYSYATRNGNSDSLVIYISTDNGTTFNRVTGFAENGSGNYATAPNTSGFFDPTDSSDWCHGPGNSCLEVPLTGAAQNQEVIVRVRNKSFGGNNLYINYVYVASDCYQLFAPIADFTANVQYGCEDLTVEFEDLSQNFPVNWNWSFPGGTPSSSTEQNPTVYYPEPGSYSVQLTASNPAGSDTETKVDFIFVEDVPEAFFTYQLNGRTVTFTNESTNANNYTWVFGDGNSSNDENPTHTYSQDGSYTVELTATNNCGADLHTTTIDIETPPVAMFTASDTIGCEPLTVIFDATSSSQNTTAYYWEFEGGDPSTSVSEVPAVTYDSAGTFDVFFVASNSVGHDTIYLQDYITVEPLPESQYLYTQSDLTVEFFNNSTDYNSLLWDFGDGNTSTDENPVHTYSSGGNYDVMLITTNNCGSDTLTQTINVDEALNALFTSDRSSGCVSFDVQFDGGQSTGANNYAWTFEGGMPSTSTDSTPVVSYTMPGTYDVTLIVSDGIDTDTAIYQDYIEAKGGPSGDFSYIINAREIELQLNASNYESLLWSFGDGNSSTQENPTHEYASDGTYNVVLTLMNECDTIEIGEQIEIATPPVADFSIDVSEGCIPLEVTFTNNSSENASTFAWTFEGGNPGTSTDENPTVTYNIAGTYDVELIAISNGGSDTLLMADAITVFPDPVADFTFVVDTLTVEFTNNSSEADDYLWDFGDGNTSSEVNPTHTYSTEGSYTVTLMAINECDTNIFTREIGTASLPSADFSVAGQTEGCVPFTVQFNDESMGTIESYEWMFEGGTPATSTDPNPTVVYNSTGSFQVTLKVTNAAGDNEIVRDDYIEVNSIPEGSIDFTILDTFRVNFEGTITGDPSSVVKWEFGDGNSSNQEDIVYAYENSGTYEVLFIVSNECGSDTSVTEITIGTTSVVQEQLAQIRVYPNPTSDIFTVDRIPLGAHLRITDQFGKTMLNQQVRTSKFNIKAMNWSAGIYYLRVLHESEYQVFRVVIQN